MADESGYITHVKEKQVDVIKKEEPNSDDLTTGGFDDLSSFCTAVMEEPELDSSTLTGSSGRIPIQAEGASSAVVDDEEELVDDVVEKEIQTDGVTAPIENDLLSCYPAIMGESYATGEFGEGEPVGPSGHVKIQSEDISEEYGEEDDTEVNEYVGHAGDLNTSKICDTKRSFSCSVCRYSSRNKAHLRNHMRVHTGEKPHICDVCGSRFSQTSHLKTHKRIHSEEKPHVCDVCGSKFREAGTLKAHWRIHSGEKPYVCVVCESRYCTAGDLKIHMRYHTGEKPYACDVCESKFSRASDLKRHKRVHSGEKPHVCDVCESRFSQAGHLRRHKRVHGGGKP